MREAGLNYQASGVSFAVSGAHMSNQPELCRRAKVIAEKYFLDSSDWSTELLICELEAVAYRVAREGENVEATRLFVLIAELSQAAGACLD